MGFSYDHSSKRKGKRAPQKTSGLQLLLIFIALGVSIWLGWWLPNNVDVRQYAPIPPQWPDIAISIGVGVIAFILLQFFVVLIGGLISPPKPKDEYEEPAKQAMRGAAVQGSKAHALAWYEWAWACLPVFLIAVGGAIGGALAGLAIVINLAIFRTNMDGLVKFVIATFVTAMAVTLYFVVASNVLSAFMPR